jgi:pimeloyl-ACP methyl ester carboxylesterase
MMSMRSELAKSRFILDVDGVELDVAAVHRAGKCEPIVFLHGFGSTKEDYADIVHYHAFAGHPILAYDAPGCGETRCADLSRISIPFLVETALAAIETVGFERFHLVGHSMGGLTALMLAHAHPHRILSFVDIEGNIAPWRPPVWRSVLAFLDHASNVQRFC